jgi:hypothetical protein
MLLEGRRQGARAGDLLEEPAMPDPDLETDPDADIAAIVAVVGDALDQLAEIATPVESGIALITAGLKEFADDDGDPRELVAAYADSLRLAEAGIARALAAVNPVMH